MFAFKVEMTTNDGRVFSSIVNGDSLSTVINSITMFPGDIVTVTRM